MMSRVTVSQRWIIFLLAVLVLCPGIAADGFSGAVPLRYGDHHRHRV